MNGCVHRHKRRNGKSDGIPIPVEPGCRQQGGALTYLAVAAFRMGVNRATSFSQIAERWSAPVRFCDLGAKIGQLFLNDGLVEALVQRFGEFVDDGFGVPFGAKTA
jgi:hypothetical protein